MTNTKFEQWLQQEFPYHVRNSILPDGKGSLMVFGRYVIRSRKDGSCTVSNLSHDITEFGSKRTAMAYCVAHKYNDLNLARRICQLDRQKTLMRHDIEARSSVAARGNGATFKENVLTKIAHKARVCREVTSELDKCITRAKYLQIRGFTNETARTGR